MQNRDYYAMADRSGTSSDIAGAYDNYIRIRTGPENVDVVIGWLASVLDQYFTFLDVLVPTEGETEILHLTPALGKEDNLKQLDRLHELVKEELTLAAVVSERYDELPPLPESTAGQLSWQIARYEIGSGDSIYVTAANSSGMFKKDFPIIESLDEDFWVPYEHPHGSYYSNHVSFRFRMAKRTVLSEEVADLMERFAIDFLGTVNNVEDVYEEHSSAFEINAAGYLDFDAEVFPKYVSYLEEMMRMVKEHPEISWDIRNIMWERDTCEIIGFRMDDEAASVQPVRLALLG